jgi:hypothetical protein
MLRIQVQLSKKNVTYFNDPTLIVLLAVGHLDICEASHLQQCTRHLKVLWRLQLPRRNSTLLLWFVGG